MTNFLKKKVKNIMDIIKNDKYKIIMILLFAYYTRACFLLLTDFWSAPLVMNILWLSATLGSMVWLYNKFFNMNPRYQKILSYALILWFSPVYVYWDSTHYIQSWITQIQIILSDISMMILLGMNYFYPTAYATCTTNNTALKAQYLS